VSASGILGGTAPGGHQLGPAVRTPNGDGGRFVLNDCPFANNLKFATYADAPYSFVTRLGGVGKKGNAGTISGISHGGHYAAGTAGGVGVYWMLP